MSGGPWTKAWTSAQLRALRRASEAARTAQSPSERGEALLSVKAELPAQVYSDVQRWSQRCQILDVFIHRQTKEKENRPPVVTTGSGCKPL